MNLIDKLSRKPSPDTGASATGEGTGAGAADLSVYDLDPDLSDPIQDTIQEDSRLDPSEATTVAMLDESSIITEAAPSEHASVFMHSRHMMPPSEPVPTLGSGASIPMLSHLSADRQQKIMGTLFGLGLLGLIASAGLAINAYSGSAARVDVTGRALMESQRLTKAALLLRSGQAAAFAELRESSVALRQDLDTLVGQNGDDRAVPLAQRGQVQALMPALDRIERNAATLLAQEPLVTESASALQRLNQRAPGAAQSAQTWLETKVSQGASAAELQTGAQLVGALQRLALGAQLGAGAPLPALLSTLDKELQSSLPLARALRDGSAERRLAGERDPTLRARLDELITALDALSASVAPVRAKAGNTGSREAELALLAETEPLRQGLDTLQRSLSAVGGIGWTHLGVMIGSLGAVLLGLAGLLRVYTHNQRLRALHAEAQRREAERQEREAKRLNDANQAAILRLMNELQSVAEGDLTQQATVTEDITGAIADSVNYTVEELRSLVSQVQGTVGRVTDTTEQVDTTSTELLAASDEQLREIRDTGEAVLQMAGRIQRVSGQAQQSADVARESLSAATSGLTAVLDTISGMNTIREQIQETSKRIKRLGESSQEIGEITELISDITEQTNVLALNAAIQAASAGEAGRGFSVVAEEVQRLAERSADATRQIAVLVRTIQTDTADAVVAMERSTQGVIEGAKLSDNAGTALAEIDRVSRQLAELIEAISEQARREAESATVVSQNIQHIFAVTEQTGEGTRSTAQLVRQLSRSAEELRQSVARFKIH